MPVLALMKDESQLQMPSRQVKLANNYSLLFLVPGNTRWQDRQEQQQWKTKSLPYLGMVNLTLEVDASSTVLSKTAVSLVKLSVLWLLGFVFKKTDTELFYFSSLFEHLKSSPGSLPPLGKPFDVQLCNSPHL